MAFRISGSFGRSTPAFCFSGVWLAVFHLAVAEELVIDPEAIKIDFTKKLVELSASAPIPDRRDLPEIPQGGFALPVAEGAIQSAPEDIYSNCRPAVVIVMAIKKCPDHADCWHGHMEGTGWIASPDGHIVTCHHVIEDAGDKMPESKLGIMTAAGKVYPIREIALSSPGEGGEYWRGGQHHQPSPHKMLVFLPRGRLWVQEVLRWRGKEPIDGSLRRVWPRKFRCPGLESIRCRHRDGSRKRPGK